MIKSRLNKLANKIVGPIVLFIALSFTGTLVLVSNFLCANDQIIGIERAAGPIENPLMGFAPWATIKESEQPFTLVYVDLTWRDLEPLEGVYDFATFENKKQLDRWRQEGKRVVFRFVVDVPRRDKHLDIPDWLFAKIDGDGDYYDNDYGKGFSPNYSNPIFIAYHEKAINALGDRYGRDGFFAFIELGSLGHWGEWHTHSGIAPLPKEAIRDIYVLSYTEAFPGIHLLMRRPFSIADDLKLGIYNDMMGNIDATNKWLDWIDNGGAYLPGEIDTLTPMPDGWKSAPIGGEQTSSVKDEIMYGSDLNTTLDMFKQSHTTFIGPGGPYDVVYGGPLQGGIDAVLTTIGYRLYVKQVEMLRVVRFQNSIKVIIEFSNSGIAPFYYPWEINLYLFDESGEMIGTYPLSVDIRKIIPGQIYPISFALPVDKLASGRYMLGVAVIDPLTGEPGIKFANVSQRGDLIQEIGSFQVDWFFEFRGN